MRGIRVVHLARPMYLRTCGYSTVGTGSTDVLPAPLRMGSGIALKVRKGLGCTPPGVGRALPGHPQAWGTSDPCLILSGRESTGGVQGTRGPWILIGRLANGRRSERICPTRASKRGGTGGAATAASEASTCSRRRSGALGGAVLPGKTPQDPPPKSFFQLARPQEARKGPPYPAFRLALLPSPV